MSFDRESSRHEMNEYRASLWKRNRHLILLVVNASSNPLSVKEIRVQIQDYLSRIRQEEIDSVVEHPPIDQFPVPSLRTIQRHLKMLLNEKFIVIKNGKYTGTLAAQNIKSWAQGYADAILNQMAMSYYPDISTLEENIDNLITIFGSYILFFFLQVSKRNEEPDTISVDVRDKIRFDALNDFLNPIRMYRMYLGTIKSQPAEYAIQKNKKAFYRDNSVFECARNHRYYEYENEYRIRKGGKNLTIPKTSSKHRNRRYLKQAKARFERQFGRMQPGDSLYELERDKMAELEEVLRKREIFKVLLESQVATRAVRSRSEF